MTIKEVAQHLRISERTVTDWVQSGKLPGGKFGEEWRFKRSDIEHWVDTHLNQTAKQTDLSVPLDRILHISRIKFMQASTKADALQMLIDMLMNAPGLKSREELEEAILHRERLMSTGIGLGVAVPHVRLLSIKAMTMAVGINKSDIHDYESLDGQPVRIIVMVAAGKGQHQEYIRLLAYLSSILKDSQMRQRLIAAEDTSFIYDTLMNKTPI